MCGVDGVTSSAGFYSSSEDIEATFSTMISPRLVLPESWIPPRVDLVNLVFEDEGRGYIY